MEETLQGFRKTGDWFDIVEAGEITSEVLSDIQFDEYSIPNGDELFEEWEEWRPKHNEKLETSINEKTSEKASIGEGEGEKKGKKRK